MTKRTHTSRKHLTQRTEKKPTMVTTAYCPTCRTSFATDANPPYSVIHISGDKHVHPITRIAQAELGEENI